MLVGPGLVAVAGAQPAAPERPPVFDEKGRQVQPGPDAQPPADESQRGKVTLPKPLNYVAPEYPAEAKAAGIEGEVILKLDIDEDGNVTRQEIHVPGGHGFDEAAQEAAKKLKFSPARRANGNPFAARILYRYEFVLDEVEPDQPAGSPPTPGAGGG
ncbi:MAG: TonB family protein, partial [Deltaproteobacteria bacterium]|nr:TonB family protein [Deltaproteobacteria bacterium]MBW2534312.1 TonB family protein [Deltaproteobacteria bacterium]